MQHTPLLSAEWGSLRRCQQTRGGTGVIVYSLEMLLHPHVKGPPRDVNISRHGDEPKYIPL